MEEMKIGERKRLDMDMDKAVSYFKEKGINVSFEPNYRDGGFYVTRVKDTRKTIGSMIVGICKDLKHFEHKVIEGNHQSTRTMVMNYNRDNNDLIRVKKIGDKSMVYRDVFDIGLLNEDDIADLTGSFNKFVESRFVGGSDEMEDEI